MIERSIASSIASSIAAPLAVFCMGLSCGGRAMSELSAVRAVSVVSVVSATTVASTTATPSTPASSASSASASAATDPSFATVLLPIADRDQDARSPPSGWCGETAIQEGLLHLGVWASQSFIHRAGKSTHPDLYSQDIPTALIELGVQHTFYVPKSKGGYTAYEAWVKDAIDHGDPVIAGVKILPTDHPDWGLDHFVVVVGYGAQGLLVNTTWGHRKWVNDSTPTGISLKNAFYAIRLRGVSLPKNGLAARLTVVAESPSVVNAVVNAVVKLKVGCAGLQNGATYRVERRTHAWDAKPAWSETLTAKSERVETVVAIEADSHARFVCVAQ